ncbi:DUF6379 domain-containing protein [uncultured Ruthenibacterium sp.]|uniref:C-glycoside deglycosidase beta subunit domain-containing protein n=1 Tax=uncultured Ruthenibacterium sp. TaxID=1905347 RepID=UPI00349EC16E
MFDKYFLCEDTFRNVVRDGRTIGFEIGVKVSYYRGVNLAVIQDFKIRVDGHAYPRENLRFVLRGTEYTFEQMRGNDRVHWDFGEVALLRVLVPGGLAPGRHRVFVYEELRIVNGMNIPAVPFCAQWEKELELGRPSGVNVPANIRRGISFYSFQDECYLGKMNLESCVRAVADMGGDGIEIISEAIIPQFPNPPQSWVDYWFYLMDVYGTKPVCYDMFMDGQIVEGQDISEEKAVEIMETNIRLAARLGFPVLRVVYTIPLSIIEKSLPCAQENNVILGLEIHPPFRLGTDWVDQYVEFIRRTGTKHFGLIPDFGIFMARPVPAHAEKAVRLGAHPQIVSLISQCYADRMSRAETERRLEGFLCNDQDRAWLDQVYGYTWCDPKLLAKYLPYVVHIHAKVFDMQNGQDPSVDNATIFRVLKENGWSGWVCTEYEGSRIYHDMPDWSIDNVELVRQHQKMMARYIETPLNDEKGG